MSNITEGMNIDEVEELGRFLKSTASDDLKRYVRQLDRQSASAPWGGQDADRFRSTQWPKYRRELLKISDELFAFGEAALRNATEQREASRAGASNGGYGACSTNNTFADNARTSSPGPQDLVLAKLASGHPPAGWREMTDQDLRDAGIDPKLLKSKSGFSATLYMSDDGTVVVSYRGSDFGLDGESLGDWKNNAQQALGLGADQYRQAATLAREVKAAFGDRMVVTGHSLGGGLASLAAVVTGSPGATFNAAALNDNTLRDAGLDPSVSRLDAASSIRAYSVSGDVLDSVQTPGKIIGQSALGTRVNLAREDPHSLLEHAIMSASPVAIISDVVSQSVKSHMMDEVIAAMERDDRFK